MSNLDDYEEWPWTPSVAFDGTTNGVTYTTESGVYRKVGDKVTFEPTPEFTLSMRRWCRRQRLMGGQIVSDPFCDPSHAKKPEDVA